MNDHSDERVDQRLDRAARLLAALSDPTRLRIVAALEREPRCVCDLAEITGVSQSGVSHQLRVLREASIVDSRREGRHVLYRLALPVARDLLDLAKRYDLDHEQRMPAEGSGASDG